MSEPFYFSVKMRLPLSEFGCQNTRNIETGTVALKHSIPFEFVLEQLTPAAPLTRPMFGCTAVYVGEKIVLILRDKPLEPEANGVWLATSREHHDSLRKLFPNMQSLGIFGLGATNWQVLPVDSVDFESACLRACDLILSADPRIGRIPKPKKLGGSKKKKVEKKRR